MKPTLLCLLLLLPLALAGDCFTWRVSKKSPYLELLPTAVFYDQVDWINLDPSASCTVNTFGDSVVRFYSGELSAKYQKYKFGKDGCTLEPTSYTYTPREWLYATSYFSEPLVCGHFITITNNNAFEGKMFSIVRTAAQNL